MTISTCTQQMGEKTLETRATHFDNIIKQGEPLSQADSSLELARTEIGRHLSFDTVMGVFLARKPTSILAVISLIADRTVTSEHLSLSELVETYDMPQLDLMPLKEERFNASAQYLLEDVKTFCAVLSACESSTANPDLHDQSLEKIDSSHTLRDYATHIVKALIVYLESFGDNSRER
jgi:hypothetical protein